MPDGHDAGRTERGDPDEWDDQEFDAMISRALNSAEWIARIASDLPPATGSRPSAGIATGWIRVVTPTTRFLASLGRLDRILISGTRYNLVLDVPVVGDVTMAQRWCTAALSALTGLLGDQATFVAFTMQVGSRNADPSRSGG